MKKWLLISFLLPLSLHARKDQTDFSPATALKNVLHFILMPVDTVTKTKVYEWRSFWPVPSITSHEQYCTNVIQQTDFNDAFPGEYTGSQKTQFKNSAADFVRAKLSTIVSGDQKSLTPKEYALFRYGPACPVGQKLFPHYHRWPYSGLVTGCKWLLLYWAYKELKLLWDFSKRDT